MKRNNLLLSFIIILFCLPSFGQSVNDLRLNELLIKNDTNFVDEYGRHVPWIEVFNSSYNFVNIGGCFLTDDTSKSKSEWYRIPTGDPKTNMPQRSFLVFYLDNMPLYGTFHVNFEPNNSKTNYIALISSNGKAIIDIFTYPSSIRFSDKSYGLQDDGIKEVIDSKGNLVSNYSELDYFTPGSTNKVNLEETKAEKLLQTDKYGIGLALISMAVVFSALTIIYIMLKLFNVRRKKTPKTTSTTPATSISTKNDESINGEEVAAITMALNLYFNSQHDEESEIITIDTPSAHYSPWSQKHLIMKRVTRKK